MEHGVLVRTLSKVWLSPQDEVNLVSRSEAASYGAMLIARTGALILGASILGLAVWHDYATRLSSHDATTVILKLAVPAIGSALCWMLAFSPLPTLLQDRHSHQLSVDPTPFPVFFTAAFGWCIFACVAGDPWPFIGNLPPMLSFFFCTCSALRLCRNQRMAEKLELLALIGITMIAMLVLLTLSPIVIRDADTRRRVIGTVAPLLTCWQAMAPSVEALSALRRRDATLLSLPLSVAGLACSSFWAVYGVAVAEPSIWVPNGMLCVLSGFNVCVKCTIGP